MSRLTDKELKAAYNAPNGGHLGGLRAVADAAVAADRAQRWCAVGGDYDRSIHNNPDAQAWADFFVKTFPNLGADKETMAGWFANAMMAMHDSIPHIGDTNEMVVPEGYALVPLEPTKQMIDEGYDAYGQGHFTPAIIDCYRAMLAAAPTNKEPT